MILLIDNYDSFTFNLQRYLVRLGEQVTVVRNDDIRLSEAVAKDSSALTEPWLALPGNPQAIVLSPGPKRPSDAGVCLEVVRRLSGTLPILGVCLGHQVICEALGGTIVRARRAIHGQATPIRLEDCPLFDGLRNSAAGSHTVEFARYHSLVAEESSLPACLKVTAWSHDHQIMAVEHRQHATFGVQFHPESILSLHGYRLLQNFLRLAGCQVNQSLPASDLENEQQLVAWRRSTASQIQRASQGAHQEEETADAESEHTAVHPMQFNGYCPPAGTSHEE